jgi:hypothetical protein
MTTSSNFIMDAIYALWLDEANVTNVNIRGTGSVQYPPFMK